MISLPVRQILGNAALASIPANRQGLGARVRIIRRPRNVAGMGYAAAPYMMEDGDFQDYYYTGDWGGGDWGDYWANPPDDYDYSTPGISPYSWGGNDGSVNDDPGLWDWLTGGGGNSDDGYLDEFGSYTDAQGNDWIFNSNTGEYEPVAGGGFTLYSTTDAYGTTGSGDVYADTIDRWNAIATGGAQVSDDELDAIIDDFYYGYGGEVPTAPIPAKTAPKADKLAWLKKMAAEAKKALAAKSGASGASSGASAAKPVAPKADGTCPTGYVKNASGQCVKSATAATANNSLAGLLSNPLYLALGAIGLILLAKK